MLIVYLYINTILLVDNKMNAWVNDDLLCNMSTIGLFNFNWRY